MLIARIGAAALAAVALSACDVPTARRSSSITNSTTDDGDLGVAALVHGTAVECTATLISPRVLLTAAHCVPSQPWPEAFFGSDPAQPGTRIAIADVRKHPQFDPATLANDLALALLAQPAPSGATPWPLPSQPPAQGLALRLVGFGLTAAGDTSPPLKRQGTTTVAGVTADELTFAPNPSQTCEGDSGGPAFATQGGVEVVVGVTSSGDSACAAQARDIRVDADGGFILQYLAATSAGEAGPGNRCFYDGNCAPSAGACVPALDDPRLSFCSPACGSCPAGMTCTSGLCRYPGPSPGALGAPCTSADQCIDENCAAPSGSTRTVCTNTCFPDLPGFCPNGFACTATQGGSACFAVAPEDGGCTMAGRGAPSGLALVVLLLWWRRRSLS